MIKTEDEIHAKTSKTEGLTKTVRVRPRMKFKTGSETKCKTEGGT